MKHIIDVISLLHLILQRVFDDSELKVIIILMNL